MLRHVVIALLMSGIAARAPRRKVFDLTHTLDERATIWNNTRTDKFYYKITDLYTVENENYNMYYKFVEFYEHMGTHIDAPSHFFLSKQAMHEIPPTHLIGPGVIIDVIDKAAQNSTYAVQVQDIERYEAKYGRIPFGAIVLMNSGWGEKYGDAHKVLGVEGNVNINSPSLFNFPGWGLEAARMVVNERGAIAVGVDTMSGDSSANKKKDAHVFLQGNNIPIIEYAANLGSCPPNGTTMIIGSIKTRGTGGAIRLLAFLDEETDNDHPAAASSMVVMSVATLIFNIVLSYVA